MIRAEKIIPNLYRDSVALMELSNWTAMLPGVGRATAVMATKANIALLAEAGLLRSQIHGRPNDLLIVIEGVDEASVMAAMTEIERRLAETSAPSSRADPTCLISPRSLQMALEDMPAANLALISTPGEYAAAEAEKALRLGLHVMIFSSDVAVEDELVLKQMGHDRGLLVMGPDCGTAIINGIPLGFANALRRGPVGAVASAGTGLQEVTSLIDRAGIGISQALGCGGRDLSEKVGGKTMLQGLAMLARDPATKVIVLIAKSPSPQVAQGIIAAARNSGKRTVVNFLGINTEADFAAGIYPAETLEDAAQMAVMLARNAGDLTIEKPMRAALSEHAQEALDSLSPHQKYIRGLFSGGTLCCESQVLLGPAIGSIWSNVAIDVNQVLSDVWRSREHTLIDLGNEVFTRGRPHPMIDLRLRLARLAQEAHDPQTAVILFDVVLGCGAHPNPAAEIVAAIAAAREDASRPPIFVASICGTDRDPQNLQQQESTLRQAGVLVAPSNAAATRLAAALIAKHGKLMGQGQ
jgi:FdrA protein